MKSNLGNKFDGDITYHTDVQNQMREQIEQAVKRSNESLSYSSYMNFRKLIDVEEPKHIVRIEELAKRVQENGRVLATFTIIWIISMYLI